jgi:hypothetical protein
LGFNSKVLTLDHSCLGRRTIHETSFGWKDPGRDADGFVDGFLGLNWNIFANVTLYIAILFLDMASSKNLLPYLSTSEVLGKLAQRRYVIPHKGRTNGPWALAILAMVRILPHRA